MYPESEFRSIETHRDKEVTVGPLMLTVLGAGLVVLCSVCFIAGYELGNHGTALPSLKNATVKDSGPSAAEILAQAKPAAVPAEPAPRTYAPQVTVVKDSVAASESKGPDLPAAAAPPVAQLRTAMQTTAPGAATSASEAPAVNPMVHPALAQVTPQPAGAWRVQIAAVEHKDDADVLISALRSRGYAVSVRHDLTDNLLHVQVGPFSSRSDAEAIRQKLQNDGYNAILQF